jgi:hypothetical protein
VLFISITPYAVAVKKYRDLIQPDRLGKKPDQRGESGGKWKSRRDGCDNAWE